MGLARDVFCMAGIAPRWASALLERGWEDKTNNQPHLNNCLTCSWCWLINTRFVLSLSAEARTGGEPEVEVLIRPHINKTP